MLEFLICVVALLAIWTLNARFIIQGMKHGVRSEVYMHFGISIFFSILALELPLMKLALWRNLEISSLRIIGFILYIPAAILLISTFITLSIKGGSKSRQVTETTKLIDSGIFRIIRQPMTLGLFIWSIALIMVFQSIIALLFGALSALMMWLSAKSEINYNIKKFGDAYREYAKRVPMWNIFKNLGKK